MTARLSAPVHAIALAGGRGIRALPLTLISADYMRSKAAISLLGKPLVEWVVRFLRNQGVTDYYVLANGRENRTQIQEILRDGRRLGIEVRYSRARFDRYNTGSGEATLRCLEHWSLEGTAVVFPTDSVFDFDLAPMLARHLESGATVTVGTVPRSAAEAAGKYGVLVPDGDGRIESFAEKPPLDEARRLAQGGPLHTSAGIYMIDCVRLRAAAREPELRALAAEELDWGGQLVPYLVAHGHRVQAFSIGSFGDLGNSRDYLATMRTLLAGGYPTLDELIEPPVNTPGGSRVHPSTLKKIDPATGLTLEAMVEEGLVRIGPRVRIGRDVEIGLGVDLEDCDVGDNVDLGEGVWMRGVACGDHAIVGPWAQVVDTVLGTSASVGSERGARTVLDGHCVLGDEARVEAGVRLTGVEVFPRLTVHAGRGVPAGARLTATGFQLRTA
ncbi:sugar phosphate nucleotidyltransferase [Actinospica robiniae]|uniref:sugar phosphate nucleotidyltransferase n=1 Tax=Actinospica robiniae TaxID=304901 RepID=UPI0004173BAF|nr:NDP-sugar synthase [Actinospica robiniae]